MYYLQMNTSFRSSLVICSYDTREPAQTCVTTAAAYDTEESDCAGIAQCVNSCSKEHVEHSQVQWLDCSYFRNLQLVCTDDI